MNRSFNTYRLSYSRLFSVPILEAVLYTLEAWLVTRRLLHSIVASRRQSYFRNKLFRIVYKQQSHVVCRSIKFGRVLRLVAKHITLDVNVNPKTLSSTELYALMWSLVFCVSVTKRTKIGLGSFLPTDFPVMKHIVIPCHEDLRVGADYIFQTAKELAQQGHCVYVIAFQPPVWIGSYVAQKIFKRRPKEIYGSENGVNIVWALTLLPNASWLPKKLQRLNQRFALWIAVRWVRMLFRPVVWCFDQADTELIHRVKDHVVTLYDCVDYTTTLDLKIDTIIKKRELELTNAVDICVVNSHILKKIKASVRDDIHIVPQGFDVESFGHSSSPLSLRFAKIPRPIVGFVGSLTFRLDFTLLFSLMKRLPHISFVFVGSYLPMLFDDRFSDTQKQLARLASFPNAHFIPQVARRRHIKSIISHFDICMIPYSTELDFNRYCYPMKLFEYFYMGKPVISTPIEELKRFPRYVKIGRTTAEWEKHIQMLLTHSWPIVYQEEQRKLAEENSWEKKIIAINHLINHLEQNKF